MSDEERTSAPAEGAAEERARHDAEPAASSGPTAAPASADQAATPPGTKAGTEPDRVTQLERRVVELEQDLTRERDAAADYMSRWQRAQADFSNYRRRQQQEREQLQRAFSTEAAQLVLPALDSFERAFATLPPALRSFTWIDGIALVHMQLHGSLRALGIQPMEVEPGHPFDPTRHEAIGEVETGEHPAGHVATIVQRGYEVGGAVLRPTLVQVARAPANVETAETGAPRDSRASATLAETPPAEGPSP